MREFLSRFIEETSGATAIEYGLIAALIALVLVGALTALGGKVGDTFNNVSAKL